MKSFSVSIVCVSCWLTIVGTPCTAQTPATGDDPFRQLQSADVAQRAKGFGTLQKRPAAWNTPSGARALLTLLEREEQTVNSVLKESNGRVGASDKYGEGFSEYHSEVLSACLRFCEKEGLLALMLRGTRSGAPRQFDAVQLLGVARDLGFSDQQRTRIDSTLLAAAAEKKSFLVRAAGVVALGNIVQRDPRISPELRTQIHNRVVTATADRYVQVRLEAVRALAEVGDRADLPLLTRIAERDAARNLSRGAVTYPVREQALRAIQKVKVRS